MASEDRILKILLQLQADISGLKNINAGIDETKQKLDTRAAVVDFIRRRSGKAWLDQKRREKEAAKQTTQGVTRNPRRRTRDENGGKTAGLKRKRGWQK